MTSGFSGQAQLLVEMKRATDSGHDEGVTNLCPESLDGRAGRALLADFAEEIATLYPGWTPEIGPSATAEELSPPGGLFLVAYADDQPVGCGGISGSRRRRQSSSASMLRPRPGTEASHATHQRPGGWRPTRRLPRRALGEGDSQPAAVELSAPPATARSVTTTATPTLAIGSKRRCSSSFAAEAGPWPGSWAPAPLFRVFPIGPIVAGLVYQGAPPSGHMSPQHRLTPGPVTDRPVSYDCAHGILQLHDAPWPGNLGHCGDGTGSISAGPNPLSPTPISGPATSFSTSAPDRAHSRRS